MLYPVGIDFEWFAVDDLGQLARFTTAGIGPVPASALEHADAAEALSAAFSSLPKRGKAILSKTFPRPDDFIAVGETGVFAYDFAQGSGGPTYELVTRPVNPTTFDDMPAFIRSAASLIRLNTAFGAKPAIPASGLGPIIEP